MDNIVRNYLKRRNYIKNLYCSHFAIGTWLYHSLFYILDFFKCFFYLLYTFSSFQLILLMNFRSKNSFVNFMGIDSVYYERVFNFASVSIDFVMSCKLGWNYNFFRHLKLFLAFIRIKGILFG
jgi:hypothetical protein